MEQFTINQMTLIQFKKYCN